MTAISTVLIGRNKLFREGLKSLFRGSQFDVVSEASDVSDVRALIGDDVPSLCLLDLSANSGHAVEDLAHLRRTLPDAKIVILTDTLSTQTLVACLAAGAHGYLIKDISVDALLQSLWLVEMGEKVLPTRLAAQLVNGFVRTAPPVLNTSFGLSARESQILQCLLQGGSNKMIGNQLNITEATIKVHMKSLLRKINVSNRTQAAIWALNNGMSPAEVPAN